MKEWPELAEELGRKAIENLNGYMTKFEAGEISQRELWLVSDAIYDTITGLASWEDAKIIYAIRQSLTK